MIKEEAIYFAGLMASYLDIPSFVCEIIEKKLIEGKYQEVIEYIIQRKRELEYEDIRRAVKELEEAKDKSYDGYFTNYNISGGEDNER